MLITSSFSDVVHLFLVSKLQVTFVDGSVFCVLRPRNHCVTSFAYRSASATCAAHWSLIASVSSFIAAIMSSL
jgi:hypothetical protein